MKKALWRSVEDATPQERLALLGQPDGVKLGKVLKHTPEYMKARNSFYRSKEWVVFRTGMLSDNSVCSVCGGLATQVHHKDTEDDINTIDSTLLEYGFLYTLQDKTKFEPICQECHYQHHKELIGAESLIKSGLTDDDIFIINKAVNHDLIYGKEAKCFLCGCIGDRLTLYMWAWDFVRWCLLNRENIRLQWMLTVRIEMFCEDLDKDPFSLCGDCCTNIMEFNSPDIRKIKQPAKRKTEIPVPAWLED